MLNTAFTLAFVVVSQSSSVSSSGAAPAVDVVDDAPRTYLWPGASIGPRFGQGGVGLVEASISYRFTDWLEPEFLAAIGPHASLPDAKDFQIVDRFSFGTRIVAPLEELRPFLWLAVHH